MQMLGGRQGGGAPAGGISVVVSHRAVGVSLSSRRVASVQRWRAVSPAAVRSGSAVYEPPMDFDDDIPF